MSRILPVFLWLCYFFVNTSTQYVYPKKCGYQSCNPTKPGLLNVHIVCHTHLDTGWVETYNDYYYKYVRGILDSVVLNLYENPNRRFIFVEVSFFSRWWNEQNETVKNRVYWLVNTGQFEFINGGWSMNDEATPQYQAVIDQMTYGNKWLNRTFGECGIPKIGWQIDPFGHSREQASIFAQMNFDGLFLGRIDYQDKLLREKTQTMEFIWKSSPSLGKKADIFTGVLPNVYWPPTGFCFDVNCFDEPIYEGNSERRAREFIKHVKRQARNYGPTNHTIITMGMDFYYRDARKWYSNLDRLIAAVNNLEQEGVHMLYSTPSCYLRSLHETRRQLPVKLDDFFPYADAYNAYWTGYFTSRPSLKYHIRYANNILQAAKQLNVLSRMDENRNKLHPLQQTLGILQHHDAVSGTCKQFVSNDYTSMLHNSINTAEESISDSFQKIWLNEGLVPTSALTFCNNLNVSRCSITERLANNTDVVVNIYNPIAHQVKHYIRLPVVGSGFRVKDSSGALLETQVVPNHLSINTLPNRYSSSDVELVFPTMLPPLGFTSFVVDKIDINSAIVQNQVSQLFDGSEFLQDATISNGRVSAVIDGQTGLLKEVILSDGRKVPLRQNFYLYEAEGKFLGEKPSGAYAFNPSHHVPYTSTEQATFKVIRGPLVEEVHQIFRSWITQVIRIYKNVDYIEFDWIVGPIPIDNWFFDHGQEIISKFETNFRTNGTFFTDSNGRETIRRLRDHRPTWTLDASEKVASNYYPITSWIFIRDYEMDLQLTVLPDRTQGGSSMVDGTVELMVHRRLLHDDGYGMEEALNEPGEDNRGLVARGKHVLVLKNVQESVRHMRVMSKSINLKPIMTFRNRMVHHQVPSRSPVNSVVDRNQFVGLNRKLPMNINLLTVEPWDDDRILLRLEHFFEVNEDPKYSRPRRVALRDLFTPFRITEVVEMNLSGIEEKRFSESKRLRWTPRFDPYANYTNVLNQPDSEDYDLIGNGTMADPFIVLLNPMEIRTFLVKTDPRLNCPMISYNGNRRKGRLRIC